MKESKGERSEGRGEEDGRFMVDSCVEKIEREREKPKKGKRKQVIDVSRREHIPARLPQTMVWV